MLALLLVVAAFAPLPFAAPAQADTSKPIKFLLSPGVDGHSNRCLQERFAGSYSMASCSLANPPPWQRWTVSLNSRTSIKIVSTHGTCIFDDGLDLSPQACTSSTASKQDWNLTYRSDGRIEIRNAETEDCLYFNTTSTAIQAVACLANVPTNSRWWFSPVSNTSTTYNLWRAEDRCVQLTFGQAVRNTCGDASTSVQMFEPAPSMPAGFVSSSGLYKWHPPVYTIKSQLPGGYCITPDDPFAPAPGQVFIPRECDRLATHKYFMVQVLPGLTSFRITGYYSNGHPDLDLPCVTMDTFDGINRPGFADCLGSLLSGIPANQRWEFVGLAP